MQIGPRNEAEEELNERFEKACAAFRKKIGKEDIEFLIVGRQGDGVFINGNGCIHSTLELADIALEKLSIVADDIDRNAAELN